MSGTVLDTRMQEQTEQTKIPASVKLTFLQKESPIYLTDGQTQVSSGLAGERIQNGKQVCLTPSTRDAFFTTPQLPQGTVGSSMRCLSRPKLKTNRRRLGRNPYPMTTLEVLLLSGVCV